MDTLLVSFCGNTKVKQSYNSARDPTQNSSTFYAGLIAPCATGKSGTL